MSLKVMTVIGTRPEIIKMAPLIEILDDKTFHILIHSGQHYSVDMDKVFFEELALNEADENLGVGSCAPGEQVAKIITGVEKAIIRHKPNLVIVHGDTNTTLGGAIAAAKYKAAGVKLAHIEAGARSFITNQAEEINRKLVDQVSDIHFAANENDKEHLLAEGIQRDSIHVTGNTVLESTLRMNERIEEGWLKEKLSLDPKNYLLATFHRQETVDKRKLLSNLIQNINRLSYKILIILPLHPRTIRRMEEFSLKFKSENILVMDPVGYKDMTALLGGAKLCITDSGGLQEEAAVLGIPSFILRERTEHQKYVDAGFHNIIKPPFDCLFESVVECLSDSNMYSQRMACHQPWGMKGIAQSIYDRICEFMEKS